MKLEQANADVQIFGGGEAKRFSFEATAKAYDAVYGGLYSDKITAILRELGCNAADSHTEAGKSDIPFEVKLPNNFDTTFYIQDYGTGIKPEDIDNVYTVCFRSTKDQSNNQTGCWGLGSKTPFGYVDNFVVENIYDGTKYTYAMYLDDERSPSYRLMGQVACPGQCNGLKVVINVNKADIQDWVGKAQTVFSSFKDKPKILGCASFKFNTPEVLFSIDNINIIKRVNDNDYSRLIMGNIAYKLQHYANIPDNCYFVVYANIGDVDIVVNRESLDHTTKTNTYIRKMHDTITFKIDSCISKYLEQSSDILDAYRKMKLLYPYSSNIVIKILLIKILILLIILLLIALNLMN